MEDGGWRMEDGGWTLDDGRWTMDDGRWRMEDGATFKEMSPSSVEDRISCFHPHVQHCGFHAVNKSGPAPFSPEPSHPPHPLASGCPRLSRLFLHHRLRCSADVTTHLTKQGSSSLISHFPQNSVDAFFRCTEQSEFLNEADAWMNFPATFYWLSAKV